MKTVLLQPSIFDRQAMSIPEANIDLTSQQSSFILSCNPSQVDIDFVSFHFLAVHMVNVTFILPNSVQGQQGKHRANVLLNFLPD